MPCHSRFGPRSTQRRIPGFHPQFSSHAAAISQKERLSWQWGLTSAASWGCRGTYLDTATEAMAKGLGTARPHNACRNEMTRGQAVPTPTAAVSRYARCRVGQKYWLGAREGCA